MCVRDDDQRRLVRATPFASSIAALDPVQLEVLAEVLHVPAVGLVALADVLGEREVRARPRSRCGCRRRRRSAARGRGGRRASTPRARRPPEVAVGGDRVACSDRRLSPSRAFASMRSASAMPTALAMPWPSGPVVVSMPGGVAVLGMARRVGLPSWRKFFRSSRVELVPGEVEHRVEQHRRVARREHEAVAVEPVRVLRVVLHGRACRARRRSARAPSACRDGPSSPSGRRPSRACGSC